MKSPNNIKAISKILLIIAALSLLFISCNHDREILSGARKVDADYTVENFFVEYDPINHQLLKGKFYLISEDCELSLYQERDDEQRIVITNHWVESDGDHFAVLYQDHSMKEFIVLHDRSQPVAVFRYRTGSYYLDENDGVMKPVLHSTRPLSTMRLIPNRIFGL